MWLWRKKYQAQRLHTHTHTEEPRSLPKLPQIYTAVKILANQSRKLKLNELPKKGKLWVHPDGSVS